MSQIHQQAGKSERANMNQTGHRSVTTVRGNTRLLVGEVRPALAGARTS